MAAPILGDGTHYKHCTKFRMPQAVTNVIAADVSGQSSGISEEYGVSESKKDFAWSGRPFLYCRARYDLNRQTSWKIPNLNELITDVTHCPEGLP
jgi:hypothetical protein